MKKLVLAFGVIVALAFSSCIRDANPNPGPPPEEDSTDVYDGTPKEVTGVAIDGAMNSVYLKVDDDTLNFSYPDLGSDKRDSWEIDDSLTVRYIETENGDSVTEVINLTD